MGDHDPIDLDRLDHPVEHDCPDCGSHHILDPAALRRFLRKAHRWGYFRCVNCRAWWPVRGMVALTPGPKVRGVCVACAADRDGDADA